MAANEGTAESDELTVKIDECLVKKLRSQEETSWGFILGKISCSHVHIISIYNASHIEICDEVARPKESEETPVAKIETLLNEIMTSIPNGIEIVGIYYNDDLQRDTVMQFANDLLVPKLTEELSDIVSFADRFLLCGVKNASDALKIEFLEASITGDNSEFPRLLTDYSSALVERDFLSSMYFVRIQCNIHCQISTVNLIDSIRLESTRISRRLRESQLALIIKSSDTLLIPENISQTSVEKFLGPDIIQEGSSVIDIEALLSMSSDRSYTPDIYSPFLICNTTVDEIVKFPLHLDVIIYVEKSSNVSKFLQNIQDSFCIQSRSILLTMAEISKEFGICKLEIFHFKPFGMKHMVSAMYPVKKLNGSDISDAELIKNRKHMHNAFMVPPDRPTFKKLQGYFQDPSSSHLINPHLGLKSGIDGGSYVVVYGKYAYHHYMQDRFDDNGWGCAYRSLQTICSWFKLQCYTTASVPDHKQIQEALVRVGDKPKSFLGSKQWIGSFEVSICLQEIMHVDSKIMHVSSGAEMAFKGRELIEHFRTQGTPVMIGGGVLAHTIIGLHFNELTGDIRFLILDPHYTGSEDLKTVQEKGWCGWKGPKFWDQSAHYNMCLPQRPIDF